MKPILITWLLLLGTCAPAFAGQATESAKQHEASESSSLGVRQQRVKRMMQDLDRKFKSLAQTLGKTEPQRAERLITALQESKELLLEQRMELISKALNEARFDAATDQQQQVIEDLKKLIDILVEEDDIWKEVEEEIKRLEEWRKEIARLIAEESHHRRESEKLHDKDKTLA